MDFNYSGLAIGLITFLVIGLFHPLVVKCEYYFGTKCWWAFLLAGVVGLVLSVMADRVILSAALGVLSFSSFWSIREIFEQKERVRKGWAKKNPKRNDYGDE